MTSLRSFALALAFGAAALLPGDGSAQFFTPPINMAGSIASSSPSTFVAEVFKDGCGAITLPAFNNNDIGIIHAMDATTDPTISAGWTSYNSFISTANSRAIHEWYRVLQTGDGNPTVTCSNGAGVAFAQLVVYRGGTSATQIARNGGTTSATVTVTGWTKNGTSKMEIEFFETQDDGSTPAGNAGWTNRAAHSITHWKNRVDEITPASYTNGTNTSITSAGTVGSQATVVEILP